MKKLIIYSLIILAIYYFFSGYLKNKPDEIKNSFFYKSIKKASGSLYRLVENTSLGKKFSAYRKTENLISDVLNNYKNFDDLQIKAKREELLKEKENLNSAGFLRKKLQGKFMEISINLLNNELENRERKKTRDDSPYKDVMEKGELEKKSFLKERKSLKEFLE